MGPQKSQRRFSMIPSNWETERLTVRDARLNGFGTTAKAGESTAYIGKFDGRPERQPDDI